MKLTSQKLVPPGGWYFLQGRYRIEGDTFKGLVDKVTAHRTSNSLDLGNVSEEIEDQICKRSPRLCAKEAAPFPQTRPGFWSSTIEFGKSLLKLGLGKDSLVSQEEANRRAAICAQCHNNTNRIGLGMICASCQEAPIAAIRTMILKGLRTASDGALKACGLCSCDNKLAVWFPLSALGVDDSNRNSYPSFCWRKDVE